MMEILIFIGKVFLALILVGTMLTLYVLTKYVRWALSEDGQCRDITEPKNTKGIVRCPKCGREVKIDISHAVDTEAEVFMCPECKYRFRFTEK